MTKTYYIIDEWGNVVAHDIHTLAEANKTVCELYGALKEAGVTDDWDFPDYEIQMEVKI